MKKVLIMLIVLISATSLFSENLKLDGNANPVNGGISTTSTAVVLQFRVNPVTKRILVETDPANTTNTATVTANQGTANAVPWNENIALLTGLVPSATNPFPTRLSDGTAFYTKTGQTLGTASFVQITDGFAVFGSMGSPIAVSRNNASNTIPNPLSVQLSDASAPLGVVTNPLRTDPVGTTTQPVLVKNGVTTTANQGTPLANTEANAWPIKGTVTAKIVNTVDTNLLSVNGTTVSAQDQYGSQPTFFMNNFGEKSIRVLITSTGAATGVNILTPTVGTIIFPVRVNISTDIGGRVQVHFASTITAANVISGGIYAPNGGSIEGSSADNFTTSVINQSITCDYTQTSGTILVIMRYYER